MNEGCKKQGSKLVLLSMSWLHEVQDEILKQVLQKTEYNKQLLEALLWRGFLTKEENESVILIGQPLALAALQTDCESLINIGLQFQMMQKVENKYPAATSGDEWHVMLKHIICLPSPSGMTAIGDGNPIYGRHLPANELDLGVALLVRAFNLHGIDTKVSGHGIESCKLFVDFENDRQEKCQRMLDRFSIGKASACWDADTLMFGQETTDSTTAFQLFQDAQRMARLILKHYPQPLPSQEELARETEDLL